MTEINLKKLCFELIQTFFDAGKKSLELRKLGLKKEIKSDNTPVTNGDIEVNKLLTKKIEILTPEIPIVSEESSLIFTLSRPSTKTLRIARKFLGDEFPIIASGGVMSKEDYAEKIDSGADLVQIYTGFIYEGPKLIADILNK